MEFPALTPARDLDEIWANFDPSLAVDPNSRFYVPRTDPGLNRLAFELIRSRGFQNAFLCGHRGSGKTTELHRLLVNPERNRRSHSIFAPFRAAASPTTSGSPSRRCISTVAKTNTRTGRPSITSTTATG